MSLYAAIDLHSSNSVLAVMYGEGKALLQCRRPNDLPRLLADLTWRDQSESEIKAGQSPFRYEPVPIAALSPRRGRWAARTRAQRPIIASISRWNRGVPSARCCCT